MIRIHRENRELCTGSLKYIDQDYNVIGYGRFNRRQATVVLVNNNDYETLRSVCVWTLGIPKSCVLKRLMLTTAEGYSVAARTYPVEDGLIRISLPPTSAVVLKYENSSATT